MPVKGQIKENKSIRISGIAVPPDVFNRIDKIVAKIPNMTRAQFCSNLLLIGLEDAELLNGLGIYTSMEYIRSMIEVVKKAAGKTIKGNS